MATQNRFRKAVGNALFGLSKNVMGGAGTEWDRSSSFLKNGIGNLGLEFDERITKESLYRGYLYAAIRTRANAVARLGIDHIENRNSVTNEEIEDQHPYLKLIDDSPSFSNHFFWYACSTYYDMQRVYLLVVRNINTTNDDTLPTVGEIQKIEILNPYNITKVYSQDGTLGGYRETRGGMMREIPKEMIIEVKSMNPFKMGDAFPMASAADDAQYLNTLAGDYTRKSIKKNVGQRGGISPNEVLGQEEFENFVAAIKDASIGEFMATNAPINYTDMQVDLEKLALDKVNQTSLEKLIAVSGVSKTMLGIEQSQISQEQAKVQKNLLIENHSIPTTQAIIDALNQDYRNYYADEQGPQELWIDSPLKVDKETDLKEAQIEKTTAEAAKVFIDAGYQPDDVSSYLGIEIGFEARQTKTQEPTSPTIEDTENKAFRRTLNAFSPGLEVVVKGYETSLAENIASIESRVFQAALEPITKKFKNGMTVEEQQKLLTKKQQEEFRKELVLALAGFYLVIIPLFAGQTSSKRVAQFGLSSQFTIDEVTRKAVTKNAEKAAASHMSTIMGDIFSQAQKLGEEGLSRAEIASRLQTMYPELTKVNATRIARSESYRAINMSQFEADRQFIAQNGLEGRAYKVWQVQSANPCPFCQKLDGKEIPFNQNFIDLGETITAEFDTESGVSKRKMTMDYASVGSGNLHPNCSCTYELRIK